MALKKIKDFQEFILNKTQLCYFYNVSARMAEQQQKIAEKELRKCQEEKEQLEEENKHLKLQIKKLLGVKKKRGSSGTTASNDQSLDRSSSEKKTSKKRGAPKGHRGNTRPIPDRVDRVIEIECPDQCSCGCHDLDPLSSHDSKYIEEIEIRTVVTQKKYMHGRCRDCGQVVRHSEAVKGPPVMVGNDTAVMLSSMRQLMGCSYRKLSLFFSEFLGFPIEPSGVLGLVNRVSDSSEPVYAGMGELLKLQKYLNADETGWKNDGARWYLWCFCNSLMTYYHADPSRGGKVVKSILGEDYTGTVICDFHGAYNFLENIQRCLIHYQRDIHEASEIRPNDKVLRKLKNNIDEVIEIGKAISKGKFRKKELRKMKATVDRLLNQAGSLKAKPKSRTAVLIGRIDKYRDSLSRFAEDPNIDFHNNRAERQIRPAVIFRKISFGNRTEQGAYRYSILSSLIQTLRLQKKNIPRFLRTVIETPEEQRYDLVKELNPS